MLKCSWKTALSKLVTRPGTAAQPLLSPPAHLVPNCPLQIPPGARNGKGFFSPRLKINNWAVQRSECAALRSPSTAGKQIENSAAVGGNGVATADHDSLGKSWGFSSVKTRKISREDGEFPSFGEQNKLSAGGNPSPISHSSGASPLTRCPTCDFLLVLCSRTIGGRRPIFLHGMCYVPHHGV